MKNSTQHFQSSNQLGAQSNTNLSTNSSAQPDTNLSTQLSVLLDTTQSSKLSTQLSAQLNTNLDTQSNTPLNTQPDTNPTAQPSTQPHTYFNPCYVSQKSIDSGAYTQSISANTLLTKAQNASKAPSILYTRNTRAGMQVGHTISKIKPVLMLGFMLFVLFLFGGVLFLYNLTYSTQAYTSALNLNDTTLANISSTSTQATNTVLLNTSTVPISTEAGLISFANRVNAGEVSLSATLEADIHLSSPWVGIGTNSNRYAGTFNGNGHSITGCMETGSNYNGLFGVLDSTASIQNLEVINAISGNNQELGTRIGGLAGTAFGGTISNCSITLELSGDFSDKSRYFGGVAGQNRSSLDTPLTIQSSAVYISGVYSLGGGYIAPISPHGKYCNVYTSVLYAPSTIPASTYNTPMLNNSFYLECTDTEDLTDVLGTTFVYCPICLRMELDLFRCQSTPPSPIVLSVSLAKDSYTYSTATPALEFAPLDTGTDEVYIEYEVSGWTVGTQTAYLSLVGKDKDKYTLENSTLSFYITPLVLDIDISAQSSVYGEPLKDIVYTLSPACDVSISFSLVGDTTTLPNAGTYSIVPEVLDSNYTLNYTESSYTILKKEVSLVWDTQKLYFNNTPQHPSAYISNLDYTPIELSYLGGGVNAGEHTIKAVLSDANLVILNDTHTYTIYPYTLDISWENTVHTFNNAPFVPTLRYTLPFEYNLSIQSLGAQTYAGTYTAISSTQDKNITILNPECQFEIKPYPLTITWGTSIHTFNNTPFIPSIEYSLPFSYALDIELSSPQVNTGVYTARASVQDKNILIENPSIEYEIKPYAITLVWGECVHTFDNTPFSPAYTYTLPFEYTPNIQAPTKETNTGTYLGIASSLNKNITILNPEIEYTIIAYNLDISWESTVHTFDNTLYFPAYEYTIPFQYTLNLMETGTEINAGTYTATLSSLDKNITLNNSSTEYTIKQREVYLTWESTKYLYTGYIIRPEYTYIDFGYNFEILTDASATETGTYTIIATCHNPNIVLLNPKHTYTIIPRECKVVWVNTVYYYDSTVKTPGYTLEYDSTDLNPSALPVVQITGVSADIGTHEVLAVCNSKNYTLLSSSTTYQILANEVTAHTGGELSLSVSGAIDRTAEVSAESITNTQAALPTEYSLIFALNIETTSKTGDLNIEIGSLPSLKEGFKILTLDTEPREIEYTYENGILTFKTDTLGTFYFVYPKQDPHLSPLYSLLLLPLLPITLIYIIRKLKQHNKLKKKNSPNTFN